MFTLASGRKRMEWLFFVQRLNLRWNFAIKQPNGDANFDLPFFYLALVQLSRKLFLPERLKCNVGFETCYDQTKINISSFNIFCLHVLRDVKTIVKIKNTNKKISS